VILGNVGEIGFIMENTKLQNNLYDYTTTINEIEEITKIDFPPFLPEEEEEEEEEIIEGYIPDKFFIISN